MFIEHTLIIKMMSVAEGVLHLPLVFVSKHRTPLTLALDDFFRNRPGGMRFNNDKVSLITNSEETTVTHLKEFGRMMTHQFHQSFDSQHTSIHQFKHCDQRELYHRHTRGSLGCPTLLVA